MMSRLEKMEKNLKETSETDSALAKVRRLTLRAHLVDPYIIMEAVEALAEAAASEKHKDAPLYRKAFRTCKKFEDNPDLGGLLVKLFGSSEDRKVQNAVNDWAKGLKNEGKIVYIGEAKPKGGTQLKSAATPGDGAPNVMTQLPGVMQFPQPLMPYYPQPSYPYYPQPPRGRGRGGRGRGQGSGKTCFFCHEPGHFVVDCPKVQKGDK